MRISTYARVTNPKYANFFEWQALAGQAGKALSTTGGAAKLGAGIGAGIGAINYLGSEDKSIGNLAGQVAGGATLGGAAGYGGSSLKNAWQARKAGQVGNQAVLQGGNPNAPQLAAAKGTTTTSAGATTIDEKGQFIGQQAPTPNPMKSAADQIRQKAKKDYEQNGIPDLTKAEPDGVLDIDKRNKLGAKPMKSANTSMNTSPFANFKVRRYNGFVY